MVGYPGAMPLSKGLRLCAFVQRCSPTGVAVQRIARAWTRTTSSQWCGVQCLQELHGRTGWGYCCTCRLPELAGPKLMLCRPQRRSHPRRPNNRTPARCPVLWRVTARSAELCGASRNIQPKRNRSISKIAICQGHIARFSHSSLL